VTDIGRFKKKQLNTLNGGSTGICGSKRQSETQSESEIMNVIDKMMLTEFIFSRIQEFLTQGNSYTHLNNLLNVTRKLQSLKHSKFCWKLNREYSLKYYSDFDYKAIRNIFN
jgi:hypothetical protein